MNKVFYNYLDKDEKILKIYEDEACYSSLRSKIVEKDTVYVDIDLDKTSYRNHDKVSKEECSKYIGLLRRLYPCLSFNSDNYIARIDLGISNNKFEVFHICQLVNNTYEHPEIVRIFLQYGENIRSANRLFQCLLHSHAISFYKGDHYFTAHTIMTNTFNFPTYSDYKDHFNDIDLNVFQSKPHDCCCYSSIFQ